MTPTTEIETAAIERLLDRLDPEPGLCTVPGCLHAHVGEQLEALTPLAA